MTVAPPGARQRGRLQRAPGVDGYRVDTFREVLQRHGLTMTLVAIACLFTPGALERLATTTDPFFQQPGHYLLGAAGLLVFFFAWASWRKYGAGWESLWILYLLWISVVEELAFRLLLPALFETELPRLHAHVLSNLVFAGIHYFTLRWRLVNCFATFLGGMGLSHLMGQEDLALVVLVHWGGTFLNTPWPPQKRQEC